VAGDDPATQEKRMLKVNAVQLFVHDQDEALAFYTEKLGMELRVDATRPDMDNFRWLTVGPVGQPELEIVLMAIGSSPFMDGETAEQVEDLTAKGVAGTLFLSTDDCFAAYEEFTSRGVEFIQPPEKRPYGVESGLRDPSGNYIRLTQNPQAKGE
jgi:predicted enzyme related to lactoylglutathione lyase